MQVKFDPISVLCSRRFGHCNGRFVTFSLLTLKPNSIIIRTILMHVIQNSLVVDATIDSLLFKSVIV